LGTGSNQAYGWQKVPNRDSLTIGTGTPSTLTYDAADRMTTSGYTHDADGRMTGQPGQTLVWDSLGRLKEVRNSSTNALISAYTYDALDRLRTVARGSTIRFRYVGTSTQVSEVVDNGTNASQLKVGNGWHGERLATWTGTNSNPRYLGTNGHGDVTWSADGSGAVVNTLRYDPWGNVAAASGSSLPDWRYQGSWNDTSTGLSWVVTRWYAPGLGQFISEDTLLGEPTNPLSRHLYVYGLGNPILWNDLDGRCPWCPALQFAARIWDGIKSAGSCLLNAARPFVNQAVIFLKQFAGTVADIWLRHGPEVMRRWLMTKSVSYQASQWVTRSGKTPTELWNHLNRYDSKIGARRWDAYGVDFWSLVRPVEELIVRNAWKTRYNKVFYLQDRILVNGRYIEVCVSGILVGQFLRVADVFPFDPRRRPC